MLPGLSNHNVIATYLLADSPGRIHGRLVDLGEYPALLLGGKRFVRGVWMDVLRDGLPALDELEGFIGIEESNDYDRVWITDADESAKSGWTYVWAESRGFPFFDGEWWPDSADGRAGA